MSFDRTVNHRFAWPPLEFVHAPCSLLNPCSGHGLRTRGLQNHGVDRERKRAPFVVHAQVGSPYAVRVAGTGVDVDPAAGTEPAVPGAAAEAGRNIEGLCIPQPTDRL